MLDEFHALVTEHAVLASVLSWLLGLLLGNWMAIGRDDRKARRAACNVIRAKLIMYGGDAPSPMDTFPNQVEIDAYERLLPPWRRWWFRGAVRYDIVIRTLLFARDLEGNVYYTDPSKVRAARERLLRCCK